MREYPSITVITATLNPHILTFRQTLIALKKQTYKGKIQKILLDGGSDAKTLKLAREFGYKILSFQNDSTEGGNRLFKGLSHARGDVILILESDNIIPHSKWLEKMVEPFREKRVFSTYPAYNSFRKKDSVMTRYTGLFGSPDPTLYYLEKSDKISMFEKTYKKGLIIHETKDYYVVQFEKNNLPTVGDNGFLVKKRVLQKVVKKNKDYIHVDAFAELLDMGYDTYGVVKDSIVHVSRASIFEQAIRRGNVKDAFYNKRLGTRKYLVFDWDSSRDRKRLFLFILFSVTIIQPLFISIYGFFRKPDSAWFIHPLYSILMVLVYGISEIRRILKI